MSYALVMSDELRQCRLCCTVFWLLERNLLRAVQPDQIDDGICCPECGSLDHRRLPTLLDYGLPMGTAQAVHGPPGTAASTRHEEDSR